MSDANLPSSLPRTPGESHAAVPSSDAFVVTEHEPAVGLCDLARDFWFFTPALLVTRGRFDRDPIAEFTASHPVVGETIVALDSQVGAFFRGLGVTKNFGPANAVVHWGNRLYAAPHGSTAAISAWIGGLAFVDRSRRWYGRVVSGALDVLDRSTLARHAVAPTPLPSINVTVFGVSATDGIHYLRPASLEKQLTDGGLAVRREAADARLLSEAAVLFARQEGA